MSQDRNGKWPRIGALDDDSEENIQDFFDQIDAYFANKEAEGDSRAGRVSEDEKGSGTGMPHTEREGVKGKC